jgi:hypothetical protein
MRFIKLVVSRGLGYPFDRQKLCRKGTKAKGLLAKTAFWWSPPHVGQFVSYRSECHPRPAFA